MVDQDEIGENDETDEADREPTEEPTANRRQRLVDRLPFIDGGSSSDSDSQSESTSGPTVDPYRTNPVPTGRLEQTGAWIGRKLTTISALLPSLNIRPIRGLPKRLVDWFKLLLIGPSNTVGTRIGTVVMVFAALVTTIGVFATLGSGVDTGSDSSWFVTTLLGVATSLWTYAGLAILFVAVFRYSMRRRYAQRAAEMTGFSVKSVLRLAAEAKTADGTSTLVASPSDSVHSTAGRILRVFETHHSALSAVEPETLNDEIVEAADASAEAADETDLVVHERANASVAEHTRLTRLELASTLNIEDILWNFIIPTMATFIGLLLAVRFWVALWVYPLLGVVSITVGALWYVFVHRRRRTHVKNARQPDRQPEYDDIAVLVKKVELPETTVYMGWCGGIIYADYDEIRLAWTLSEVAHAHIEGKPVPPTIQQKFWRNLTQYTPNLQGYEEAVEKREIMDALVETVARTDSKMLPKNKLCDRVVRRDKQRVGGVGYDPRLVAEMYREIVPYALIEDTVDVETPTGERKEMTVVRLRTKTLPSEVARTEAQFSIDYQPDFEPDFSLPDVEMPTDV
jgi:hypothetical protein